MTSQISTIGYNDIWMYFEFCPWNFKHRLAISLILICFFIYYDYLFCQIITMTCSTQTHLIWRAKQIDQITDAM